MSLVHRNIIIAFTISLIGLLIYQSHLIFSLLCLEGIILSLFILATLAILNSHFSQHNTSHLAGVHSVRSSTQVSLASSSIKYLWHWLCTKPQPPPVLKFIIPTVILIPLTWLSKSNIIWINSTTHSLLISFTSPLLLFKTLFIYLFMAVLGLRCYAWAFSICGEQGLFFVVVHGLLIVVASVVAEHGL